MSSDLPLVETIDNKIIRLNLKGNLPEFAELYGDDPDSLIFSFDKQRFFHKKIHMFADDIMDASASVDGYLEFILQLNKIALSDEYNLSTLDDFIDLVYTNLTYDELINYVVDRVENNYDIDIEIGHELSSKENAGVLQFTNKYAKRILCVGLLARLTFPVIGSFINKNKAKSKEHFIFMEAMNRILSVFNEALREGDEVLDLATKIQKFVQVNVDNTLYSDKVIWGKLEAQNINNDTVSQDINRAIFTHIVPKLELGRSIVSFLHVFIKNQINYEFHKKFKLSYKPITKIVTEDDTINPFVSIEQRLVKTNTELDNILIKLEVKNFIEKHDKLSNEDLIYHLQNITIHTAQTRIIGFFISKVITHGIPVLSLSKVDYIKILFIAKDWFEANNFSFIPFILLGSPGESFSIKQNLGRGKSLMEITSSKIYNDLSNHYNFMGDRIDFTLIINFINELINTNFSFYTMPNGDEYDIMDINVKDVVYELLRFIESL